MGIGGFLHRLANVGYEIFGDEEVRRIRVEVQQLLEFFLERFAVESLTLGVEYPFSGSLAVQITLDESHVPAAWAIDDYFHVRCLHHDLLSNRI
jgi:hypothetical protein